LTRLLRSLSTEQYRAYRDKCDRTFRELSAALNRSAAVRSMDEKQRLGGVANAAKLAAALSLERHSAGQGALDTACMRWASGGRDYGVTPDMVQPFKSAGMEKGGGY
jgi:hypothetical protein